MVTIKDISISELKLNSGQIEGLNKNPRFIKDTRFEKLKKSIQDAPEMLKIRELVVFPHNGSYVVIGGNMRLRAMRELGYKSATCKLLSADTTPEALREYTIKDNVSFGQDDIDLLSSEWDLNELDDWGLEFPDIDVGDIDALDQNKEIDIDDLDGSMTIKLQYSDSEYWQVKEQLSKVAKTPEQAVWLLLGNVSGS